MPRILKNCAPCAAALLSLLLLSSCHSLPLAKGAPGKGGAPGTPSALPSPTPQALLYPQRRPVAENLPVKIRSEHLHYNDRLKRSEFSGHVVATHDTETLYADHLLSSTQGESAQADGHLRLLDPERHIELFADEGDYSGSLSESNLRGNVLLHSVDPYLVPVTVTGETGWFQSVSRLAKLKGHVHMYRGNLSASAETADLNGMLGQVHLGGGVEASQGINTISSQEALADDATHSIVFLGNVDASLIPSEVRESANHPERP